MSFWAELGKFGVQIAGEIIESELQRRRNNGDQPTIGTNGCTNLIGNASTSRQQQSASSTAGNDGWEEMPDDEPPQGNENETAEEITEDQMFQFIARVRYPGEIADRKLLSERYHVDVYLQEMRLKALRTGEDQWSQAMAASKIVLSDFMPRVYGIAQQVLENLHIEYSDITVRILPTEWHNGYVKCEQSDEGRNFTFILSSAYLSKGYTDAEIAFLFGIRLYEDMYDAQLYAGFYQQAQDESEESHCILPRMASLAFHRLYRETFVSMDRVGLLANGGNCNAALSCLIKEFLGGDLGTDNLVIPDERSLKRYDTSDGHLIDHADEMDESSFSLARLTFLHKFSSEYMDVQAEDDDALLAQLNQQIDQEFQNFIVHPHEDDKERLAVMHGIAAFGMDLIVESGDVREEEIHRLLEMLLDYTSSPQDEIVTKSLDRSRRRHAAETELKRAGNDALVELGKGLMSVVMTSGPHFEKNVKRIVEILTSLGLDETCAQILVTEFAREIGSASDPVLDDHVACARARLEGRAEPPPPKLPPLKESKNPSLAELVRYSDDLERERLLGTLYHLDTLVSQRESVEKRMGESSIPEKYWVHLHLTKDISPRVCHVLDSVRKRLGFPKNVRLEAFCDGESRNEINAYATEEVTEAGRCCMVVIAPRVLEEFDDGELAYVIGHELGHLIYRHNRWGYVEKDHYNQISMLPYMGDKLYWQWQQRCEISCDRAGAVAAGSAASALSAALKVAYGLSKRNMNANADVLLSQLEQVRKAENLGWCAERAAVREHPIDPLRINALKAFCDAYYGGGELSRDALREVDQKIDDSYELIRHQPRTEVEKAIVTLISSAGLQLLKQDDGSVSDQELKTLVKILFEFTDMPENELIADEDEQDRRIHEAIDVMKEDGDDDDKHTVMFCLGRLAFADGALSEDERKSFREFAQAIEFDGVEQVIGEVVATFGMPVDFMLEDHVKNIRDQLVKRPQPKCSNPVRVGGSPLLRRYHRG